MRQREWCVFPSRRINTAVNIEKQADGNVQDFMN